MRIKYSDFLKISEEEFVNKILNDLGETISSIDDNEIESWKKTRDYFLSLDTCETDFYLHFEFKMPFSGERVDCLIEGDSKLFIFEFKQWNNENDISYFDDDYVLFHGKKRRNPFSQVVEYCRSLFFENEKLYKKEIKLVPIVVLPNFDYEDGKNKIKTNPNYVERTLLFDKNKRLSFENLDFKEGCEIFPLDFSNVLSVMDLIKNNKIPGINDEFVKFNQIIKALNEGNDVIVHGTAGSGKTVLALTLLNSIIKSQRELGVFRNVQFSSIDGKPKSVMYSCSQELKSLFENELLNEIPNSVFTNFWSSARSTAGDSILIFDESQRMLLEQVDLVLGNRMGLENQLIWFIDDNQSIEVDEDNSLDYLRKKYAELKIPVFECELDNLFRCGGDTKYIKDLRELLDLKNISLKNYPVYCTNDIVKAYEKLKQYPTLNRGIVHTDSWSAGRIKIKDKFYKNSLKEFGRWQSDNNDTPASVFKAQGCQKDYILFLWGNDIVIRNNAWFIQNGYVMNKKWEKYLTKNVGLLYGKMKSILYVLMTRHMKELIIYFDDDETYKYFIKFLKEID